MKGQLDRMSTDPRDQVFAIVGLTKARDSPDMTPKLYSISGAGILQHHKVHTLEFQEPGYHPSATARSLPICAPFLGPRLLFRHKRLHAPIHNYHGDKVTYQASWGHTLKWILQRISSADGAPDTVRRAFSTWILRKGVK